MELDYIDKSPESKKKENDDAPALSLASVLSDSDAKRSSVVAPPSDTNASASAKSTLPVVTFRQGETSTSPGSTPGEGSSKPYRLPQMELSADRPLLLEPRQAAAKQFSQSDGTYHLDEKGRVNKTVAKDGSLTREYKFEDPGDPNKVTNFKMNGTTEFQRTGERSFAVFNRAADGSMKLSGNWHGDLTMSDKGVLGIRGFKDSEFRYRGATGVDLTADQVAARQNSPKEKAPDPARPDGTPAGKDAPSDNTDRKDGRTDAPKPGPRPATDIDRKGSGAGSAADGKDGDKKDRPGTGAGGEKKQERPDGDRRPAPAPADATPFDGKQVKLDDGTYKRDTEGRITEMLSPDGKTKRAFKYEDAGNPNRITTETINDKTEYRYLGAVTSNGTPIKENGFEVNSYSIYTDGQLSGNWAGIRAVSENGVRSVRESGNNGDISHAGADGKKISEEQRTARENGGIWPSQFETTSDDGTKYTAKLKGTRLDSLTENRKVDGLPTDITWNRTGDTWQSDQKPPGTRKNLELGRDGSLRYDDVAGAKHLIRKDGTKDITADGITKGYDKESNLRSITQKNGDKRSFEYSGKELVSIIDQSKTGKSVSTRQLGSDEWTSGGKTEKRKDLKITADGSVEFSLANGNGVRLTKDLARVELDAFKRPVNVQFESGSSRNFSYDAGGLRSITDTVKQSGKETSKVWNRVGDSKDFALESNGKKTIRTIAEPPAESGDVKYKAPDGKERVAKVRDVERQAKGELTSSSESVQEARDQFVDAAKAKGLNTERLEKYLNEFEAGADRYKLKPEQLAKSLDHLSSILTSTPKVNLYTEAQRKSLVETAMHNIARPMEIDQGYHPTCNVTTVEVYAAARHPEEYARMCKEIALNGNYKTSDGKTVTPPKAALLPGEDERTYDLDKPNSEKRNLASQVVEMTLINGLYETGGVTKNGAVQSDTRYVMDKVSWKNLGNGSMAKVGEDRLVNTRGQQMGRTMDGGPEFTQTEVLGSSKMMLGYDMPYVGAPVSYDAGGSWKFDLPQSDRLVKAKAEGKLPMGVPTLAGAHVQTIHDVTVDSKGTTWVLLDNQHGEKKDGWVTLRDLHRTQTEQNYECEPTIRRWQRPAK